MNNKYNKEQSDGQNSVDIGDRNSNEQQHENEQWDNNNEQEQQMEQEQSNRKYEHAQPVYRNNENNSQYNTFHPKSTSTFKSKAKNNQTEIDYSKGIAQYLNTVNRVIDLQCSPTKEQSKYSSRQDQQSDRDIQMIINQVLNKRKKQSRLSNVSNEEDTLYGHKKNISNTSTHIDIVNERLRKENQDLAKNIKKLTNKIKQFNHVTHSATSSGKSKSMSNTGKSAISTPNTSVHANNLIDQKRRQLEKLKQRLEKAEKANSRMELQLSKLQLSRRTNKSKLKSVSRRNQSMQGHQQYQINIKCPNCPGPSKTVSRRPTQQQPSNTNSPLKKDYYSPIMQFQQYSLNNQPTISMYDGTMQRTSQFGINLIPSEECQIVQMADKETQAAIGLMECLQEQKQLDQQIRTLEDIIRKNNGQISKYQNIFMKQML